MDFLPNVLRSEWMTAIGREGSGAVEKAALNICRVIGDELQTMQTDTKERQARLEVFAQCVQTVLFTYGERTSGASDGDTTLMRECSWDFYAAVLSVYLDILALLTKSFDENTLDTTANHFASHVSLYLKDSVLHMMDVFLQSEQMSLLVEYYELIAPSVKLMASSFPTEPSLWEYARAIILVHRLKLTSNKSAEFHRTLMRAKTPEDAPQFFASTIGVIEQTNNNHGDLTRHLLGADLSVDDFERIIEALTSATESSECSNAVVSAIDSADESPMDDDLIIDRGPVEAMDDDEVEMNPVVGLRDGETSFIEADTTVSIGSSTSGRSSGSKLTTTTLHSKRKFTSISSGEQDPESPSRPTSARVSSPIGCVDIVGNDRSSRVADTAEETQSPVRRSRRISHLSASPADEAKNGTKLVEQSGKTIALDDTDDQNDDDDENEASDDSDDEHDDDEEEKASGKRVRTAPSGIGRRAHPRPAEKLRVSAPTTKTTANGEPTPPLKMRLRSKTNPSGAPTVDLTKTPVAAHTALKNAKTAKATKATSAVAPKKTELRVNKRNAKTPKH